MEHSKTTHHMIKSVENEFEMNGRKFKLKYMLID